jgi:hypothetical protein
MKTMENGICETTMKPRILQEFSMIELEHSPLGGSAAHRFMTCTASFLVQRTQIENGEFENIESEYAKLGTGAHELGATAIAQGVEPFEFIGETFNGYVAGWPDGIELDAVHIYFNDCMKILANRKEQGHMLLEDTIHLPHIHPLFKGTIDFGFWSLSDGVKLRDYKNGEGIGVSAPGNRQLLYYGFLMVMSDAALQNAPRDLPVELGIVQPNFYGMFEEPDVWTTTLGEVLDWGNSVLIPRMNALTERQGITDADYVPGQHCQFCPVLLDCIVMQRAFEEFATASEDFIVMLTDTELDHFYSQREYARRFMNALEETVRARLIGGSNIPSAKLVEKRVNRVWKPGATAALQAAFGDAAYKPKEIKSPAQIEKVSSRGKDMALEWGYKPESNALSVAPLSDPRPEAKPRTNANTFAAHAQSYKEQGF